MLGPFIEPVLQQDHSKKIEVTQSNTSFPWSQFLSSLWPHIITLTIAIVTAMGVAILNTKIGVSIGSIVNVLSANLPNAVGSDGSSPGNSFINQIKEPAVKIMKYYLSHAALTFAYIYSLSIVGKHD